MLTKLYSPYSITCPFIIFLYKGLFKLSLNCFKLSIFIDGSISKVINASFNLFLFSSLNFPIINKSKSLSFVAENLA